MSENTEDWKKIIAYISGNLSTRENEQFELWIRASQANHDLFNETTKIWKASKAKTSILELSTDNEWLKLKSNIHSSDKPVRRWIYSPYPWISLAACILLFLFVGKNFLSERKSEPAVVTQNLTTITATDHVVTFQLPDSSKIWINISSSVSFSENFLSERKINLQGEAFFNVRSDSMHPFEVITNSSKVTVLGTTFNVKATKEGTSVVVAEGKVNLRNVNTEKGVNLIGGEKGESVGANVVKAKNEDNAFDGWRKENNSKYSEEVTNPLIFIIERHASLKNQINQTVIEGTIKNNASLASYQNIELSLTYAKQNGKKMTSHLTVNEIIRPGEVITYRKRLFDIFAKNTQVKVKIEKIDTVN
jgi:transmembrane sensor